MDEEILETLYSLLHSVAGSGAMFGFPIIVGIAREAYILLKAVIEGKQIVTTVQGKIQSVLDRLNENIKGVQQ